MPNNDDPLIPGQPDAAAGGSGDEREQLTELVSVLRQMDRLAARATLLVSEIDGARAVAEEGLPVDTALQLNAGWTRADVNMLLTAADVLARMPVTAGLFDRGTFSWGHVRQLTTAASRFDRDTMELLDRHLGRHADRLEAMEPEQRQWAIEDAIADHTPQRQLERREEADERADVLVLTPRLDGTGTGWFDLNPEAFTTVTGRLNDEADSPLAAPCATDHDGDGGAGRDLAGLPKQPVPSRGKQLADALVRICSRTDDRLPSAPTRTSLIIDVDRVGERFAGELVPALATRPPRVLRRSIDRLTCDTDLDIVLRSGTDLLAAKRYQDAIPAATRRALAVRDGGCRFPACRAPVGWTDVHHVIEQSRHRDHDLSNVVLLCRRHHTLIHRGGWRQHLRPDGRFSVTRRGRTWTTLPRHDQQLPPPEPARHRRSRAGPGTPPGRGEPDPARLRSASNGSARASADTTGTDPPRRQPPPDHDPIPF